MSTPNQERAIVSFDAANREEERRKLQELNSRLRVVLEREQTEATILKSRVLELKEKEATIKDEKEKLSLQVGNITDEVLDKYNKHSTCDIDNSKVLHVLHEKQQEYGSAQITGDSHLKILKEILQEKQEEYNRFETGAAQYQAKLKDLVAERSKLLLRRGQLMEELLDAKKDSNQKDSDFDHLQLQLHIQELEKLRLQEKQDAYTGKDPRTYYRRQYELKLLGTVKDLEAKYSDIRRLRTKGIEEEYQKQLEKHTQEDHQHKEAGNQIAKECADLREEIHCSNLAMKKLQDEHKKLQEEISEKEGLILEKALEIQAAVVLKKTTSQEKISLEKRNQDLKEIIKKLKDSQVQLTKKIEVAKKRSAKQLQDLNEEIDGNRQKISFLSGQLNFANIDMDPEINKYKGLVEIAEYNFNSERPQKKTRLGE